MTAYTSRRNSINFKAMSDIREWVDGTASFVQAVHKEAISQATWRLIQYTAYGEPMLWKNKPPKGYKPGMMKANWLVGIDSKPVGYDPTVRDLMGYKTLESISHFGRWTLGHTIYIVNNVPYAYRIETGTHSWQIPPGGIVGRVRKEWKSIVRQAVDDVKHTKGKTGSMR